MRGEKEQNCLDTVKRILKKRNKCLGCLDENDELFEKVEMAQANTQASIFPDFLFEHFQVAASNETAKGSAFYRKENEYKIQTEKDCDEIARQQKAAPFRANTITTISHEFTFDENSYEYFVKSFKRNFEKHIDSLKKYDGQRDIGVFLVEQVNAMIFVEGTYPTVQYSLFFDKDLLEYIYSFRQDLRYVIFINGEYVDLVKIERIPKIMQYVPQRISFKAGRTSATTLQCFIDLQI